MILTAAVDARPSKLDWRDGLRTPPFYRLVSLSGFSRRTCWEYMTGRRQLTRLATARRLAIASGMPERALDVYVRPRRYDMSRRGDPK